MKVNQAEFSISAMCRVLEVSPSGYYAWRSRGRSSRAQADAVLSERVKTIHEDSDGTYGVARIHAELKEEQVKVGAKRLARLMKEQGLRGVCRRRSWKTTVRDERQRPAQDLVEREFSAQAPNQLWVADITYGAPGSRRHRERCCRGSSMSGMHPNRTKEWTGADACYLLRDSTSRSGGDLPYIGRVT